MKNKHPRHRVLFICRKADYHFGCRPYNRTTGLLTSAGMCSRTLVKNGVESKLVIVNDNNDIDREVHSYKPTHVIIEALWVVPEKFDILQKLYPKLPWIIRLHSEVPFMANEGISTEWIPKYVRHRNVYVSGNSERLCSDIEAMMERAYRHKVVFLPNCYIEDTFHVKRHSPGPWLEVACFGAVRPLKNMLTQAVAAVKYADRVGRPLRFHINSDRVEQEGNPVLKNIRNLFAGKQPHTLVEHCWMEHEELLTWMSSMDVGLQVSFTESFNHVAADYTRAGLPMVTSSEVRWSYSKFWASPTDTDDIARAMGSALWWGPIGVWSNQRLLRRHARAAEKVWVAYFA